jgi:predicted SnoaL-like aldol condensation-catalyzing enzyme
MSAMKSHLLPLASALILCVGCAGSNLQASDSTPTTRKATMTTSDPKAQVTALLSSIETGEPGPISVIDANHYTQHNLSAADGLAGFGELMKALPKGSARVKTVRVFRDGDFVFTHTDYDFFGPKVGFDIFRFQGGKIVEHWDNLQEKPQKPNPSGHTMLDGPTEATHLEETSANKALVASFVDDILVHGRMEKLATYIDGDHYTQHNPAIADGLSGLGAALAEMAKHGVTMKYDKVHRVLGEGNFVLTSSEGTFGGKPTAFYDLFRVEQGKIVEHWDTIETIPARSDWKNSNGKF